MLTTSARTACAAAAALALLLTGCAGGDDGKETSPSSSSEAKTSSGDASSGDEGSELDQAGAEAGIDPTKPPEPLASVTMPGSGKVAGNEPTEITLDLLSLRREGDLLVLNLAFTPKEGKAASYYGWTGTRWAPQIVDPKNLKVHDVVQAGSGEVATQTGPMSIDVGGGETLYLYAVFAAPPKGVDTVTVKPADGAPAFTGVKIQ